MDETSKTVDPRLPVWLVAGTHGCGKTTLLQQLLPATQAALLLPTAPHAAEARLWKHLGIYVAIAQVFIVARYIFNECESTPTQDPHAAAHVLQHSAPQAKAVFLEVPADASLNAMHALLDTQPLAAILRVHACITLVDAAMLPDEETASTESRDVSIGHQLQRLADHYVSNATMLVVHRTDLVGPRTHATLLQRLRQHNPSAPILTACFGQVLFFW